MPNSKLKLKPHLKRLSILNEHNECDEALLPDIEPDTLRSWYRAMVTARRFDARLLELQREGRIGTFAPVQGQEAAQIGAVSAIESTDWLVPSFRELAALLYRGTPMHTLLMYDAGFNEGGEIAEKARDLPIAIPVASQLPHAVGIGYAMRHRDDDAVVLCFFGDGATSEGDFHEALNFAAVWSVPVIFVCQNNQWAISTPRRLQTHAKTIAQKAVAYGMPGVQVDGNDVFAVHVACRDAVERARGRDGPSLIEAVTYRMGVHTTADDPGKYRSKDEEAEWRERDPIDRFERFLRDRGHLDAAAVAAIEDAADGEIDSAWQRAHERMKQCSGDPSIMFDHLYAELPPYIAAQRREVERWSQLANGGANAAANGADDD